MGEKSKYIQVLTTSSFPREVGPCVPFPRDVGPCIFSWGCRSLYISFGLGSCTFLGDVGSFTFPRDVGPFTFPRDVGPVLFPRDVGSCTFSEGCRQRSHGTRLFFDRLEIRAFECSFIKTPSRSKFLVNV